MGFKMFHFQSFFFHLPICPPDCAKPYLKAVIIFVFIDTLYCNGSGGVDVYTI